MQLNMDMKSKKVLFIVLSGYLFNLAFYLIVYITSYVKSSFVDSLVESAVIVFGITTIYLFLTLLIFTIGSFQKPRPSFFLVSIITLLTFFLISFLYHPKYHKTQEHRLSLKQDKTGKAIDLLKKDKIDFKKSRGLLSKAIEPSHKEKSDPERKLLAAKNEEVQKQLKEAKGKIQAEVTNKKEIEAKLNKATLCANESETPTP